MASRIARLAAIATVGGIFSGVFGVGGGLVIVPLLVIWLGYEEREATGTSLAAIAVIGTLAAGAHAYRGAVDVPSALLVGLPAVAGVVAGTALQQRVSVRAFSAVFAVLLVLAAGLLLL
ncbi:MAG: TSUP family transporter [Thermoleophilaceae bacterium]|jgi:uncharacterized membrane protein YfcA